MDNWGDSIRWMICGGFSTEKPTNSKGYGTNSIPFFFVIVLGWWDDIFVSLSIPGPNGVTRF